MIKFNVSNWHARTCSYDTQELTWEYLNRRFFVVSDLTHRRLGLHEILSFTPSNDSRMYRCTGTQDTDTQMNKCKFADMQHATMHIKILNKNCLDVTHSTNRWCDDGRTDESRADEWRSDGKDKDGLEISWRNDAELLHCLIMRINSHVGYLCRIFLGKVFPEKAITQKQDYD